MDNFTRGSVSSPPPPPPKGSRLGLMLFNQFMRNLDLGQSREMAEFADDTDSGQQKHKLAAKGAFRAERLGYIQNGK